MSQRRRYAILRRLGLRPDLGATVAERLDAAFTEIESAGAAHGAAGPFVDALDAGCGRRSALTRYRSRMRRFVGIDVHEPPADSLPDLDAFELIDVCGDDPGAINPDSYDIVLSSFTVEHFAAPARAFANMHRWIRSGGHIVITTVNRRHPFVGAYLSLPAWLQRPLQRQLKASPAEAHPLVGRCNDPATVRAELEAAGFVDVHLATVPNIARAWGRHLPFFVLGLIGDLLAQPFAGHRSTIVADGRVP